MMNNCNLSIVTGPSKGGKSLWAEKLLKDADTVLYIATGSSESNDNRWKDRIQIHKNRRPSHWNTIETARNLNDVICQTDNNVSILIDSLGGYVLEHLSRSEIEWKRAAFSLKNSLINTKTKVVLVVEEVGWGVVPHTDLGNIFRDRLGELSQELQHHATTTWLVVQGRAINLSLIGIEIND